MRAAALVRTSEPDALRMRSHFAHKVPVEVEGAVSRVRLASGEFELEVHKGSIAVRASSPDEEGLARVREVVASHLARFARADEVAVVWDELERRAEALVGGAELSHRGGAIGPDRGGGIHDQAPARRARMLATEGRVHGNKG